MRSHPLDPASRGARLVASALAVWALLLLDGCRRAPTAWRHHAQSAARGNLGPDAGPGAEAAGQRVESAAPATPPPVRSLRSRTLAWSPKGDLVAGRETQACGPPTGRGTCRESAVLRALDPRAPAKEATHAPGEIFGFRADGAWIVLRADGGDALEEWAPRTGEVRPSAFAAVAEDARRLCLSPDDTHAVAVVGEAEVTVVRSRAGEPELRLDTVTFAPLPPTDCAFSPDGKRFALASEGHVGVYRLGEPQPSSFLPLTGASHLAWSPSGAELSFDVRDTELSTRIAFTWKPGTDVLRAAVVAGPSAPDGRGNLVERGRCEWSRLRVEGDGRARLGAPSPTCFHVHEDDVAVAPDGRFAAALEGEWASRSFVTVALPR